MYKVIILPTAFGEIVGSIIGSATIKQVGWALPAKIYWIPVCTGMTKWGIISGGAK